MKKLLIVALALLLGLPFNAFGAGIKGPSGFEKIVSDAAFILVGDSTVAQDICTATVYEKTSDGYNLVGAGHCVVDMPGDTTFTVASDTGGPTFPVTVIKAVHDDKFDFAIFHFPTKKHYPVIPMGTEDGSRLGDAVVSVQFAHGLAKQLSRGTLASRVIGTQDYCDICVGKYLVQAVANAGASGAAVVSLRTHRIIGTMIAVGDVGVFVEPASRFSEFLAAPSK